MIRTNAQRLARILTTTLTGLLALELAAVSPTRAAAAAGQLDNTFANGGIFLAINAGIRDSVANAVAIDSKGRIVVAGETLGQEVGVLRLNSNGTLDTSFGDHGVASVDFFVPGDIATCVVLQPDGKIVIGVSFADEPALLLIRFDENGALDTTFGGAGLANLIFNGGPNTAFVLLLPDGRFLVGGGMLMARVTADGKRDTTFGQDGLAPLVAPAGLILLQSDGKILAISGPTGNVESTPLMSIEFFPLDSTIVRYNEDGSLDTSLATLGRIASIVGITGAQLQSNGQIVAVGPIVSKSIVSLAGQSLTFETAFAVARYNSDGVVDDTFGSKGAVITSFDNAPFAFPSSVVIQSDGRIIAAGEVDVSPRPTFALARYISTGVLDTSFGSGGTVITSIGPSSSRNTAGIVAIALDGEGRLVAVGNLTLPNPTGYGRPEHSMVVALSHTIG